MLFLINNPFIAFALLVVIGFTVLMITKIYEEIKINRALNIKHMSMRINEKAKKFKTRITLLSSATLAPAALVIALFIVGSNPNFVPTGELVQINTAKDVLEIYEDFNEKLNSSYEDDLFSNLEVGLFSTEEADSFRTTTTDSFEGDILGSSGTSNYTALDGVGSDDYSLTNNQIIGVDEMDNVLTDGKFIYSMYNNEIDITLAYIEGVGPEVLSLYKTISYDESVEAKTQFYPSGMYIDDDYLVVIGNLYTTACYVYSMPYEGEPETDIITDDVDGEDSEEPKDTDEECYDYYDYYYGMGRSKLVVYVYDINDEFELRDTYKLSGNLIGTRKIVTDSSNSLYIVTSDYIPFYLDEVNVDDYLASYTVNDQVVEAKYSDIVYIEGTSPNSFTTFYGINLDTTKVDMETVLGDSGYNLFVSNENIYLVGTIYYFLPVSSFVDVAQPIDEYRTAILKVAISESKVEFSGKGFVLGHTLDQFSMDEHNGNLRITTTSGWWGEEINNRLYILDENLKEVSVLENLGKPGETIKSTRFMGDYAYVVTFRQTDPFYVLNLSDPLYPFIEGELEIFGYSAYLQQYGENHMIGLGFSADDTGRVDGLKISIYDISDKTAPIELDNIDFKYEDMGWSNSTAIYNHKDLLLSFDKGIIALPFSTSSFDQSIYEYRFNSGVLVYNIDLEDGFEFNGFVTHEVDSLENVYVYKAKFISDFLYTISNKYIKVSTIIDSETILYSVDLD